jgi:Cytochrome c554 and c-prime
MKFAVPTRLAFRIAPLLAIALGVSSILFARGAPAAQSAPTAQDVKYIGATKCKSCHSSEETGNQYAKWSGMNHAKAWETLGTDKAKELAKAKGIADPQQSEACLKCHVTGYGLSPDHFKGKWDPKLGVQCESCHGPGDAHMKARMADAAKRDPTAPVEYKGVPAGEIADQIGEAQCRKCHNEESPSFKGFCYHTYTAKIRHLNPLKKREGEPKMECTDPCHCTGECTHKCPPK